MWYAQLDASVIFSCFYLWMTFYQDFFLFAVVVIKCFMIGVNVWWVYLAPKSIPRTISILTLGNKVILCIVLYCIVMWEHWQTSSSRKIFAYRCKKKKKNRCEKDGVKGNMPGLEVEGWHCDSRRETAGRRTDWVTGTSTTLAKAFRRESWISMTFCHNRMTFKTARPLPSAPWLLSLIRQQDIRPRTSPHVVIISSLVSAFTSLQFCVFHNNNNVHLSCTHQRPERSHDTY